MYAKYLPRSLREHIGAARERYLALIGSDKSKNKPLKSYFKSTGTIFIHIPKCAGTSVSETLYGEDPWHFSIKHYSERAITSYVSFAIVRDPVDRFYSSFYYLQARSALYPRSIYTDAAECDDAADFFTKYIQNQNDRDINYFLRSQQWYLTDINNKLRVDFIIPMNSLDRDFPLSLRKKFNYFDQFPHKNKKGSKQEARDKELVSAVANHYKGDYELLQDYL